MALPGSRSVQASIRRFARGASLLCFGFLLLIVAGELFFPQAQLSSNARDIVGLILFPGIYALGLLLAWRYELLGGSISLLSMLAFYGWLGWQDGSLPRGWILPLLALPAIFFVLYGICKRTPSEDPFI